MNQELYNNMDIQKLFNEQRKVIGEMAKEIAEREFELLQLNMFVSSLGEKKLRNASEDVQFIRKLEKEGKVRFNRFEEIAEEF